MITAPPTYEDIKARVQLLDDLRKGNEACRQDYRLRIGAEGLDDLKALCGIVEALQHLAKPVAATEGLKPLVVYFKTDHDRQEFAAAVAMALPGARSVVVP